MQEIEVGEYIRTADGIIGKIFEEDDIEKNGVYTDTSYINEYCDETNYIERDNIVKHSKNIIDLIEIGDYVNGYRVVNVIIDPAPSGKCVDIDSYRPSEECTIWEEGIKSIVTKEQIESIEYKI